MIEFIGQTFPDNWYLGPFEKETITKILKQITEKFPNDNNIVINTTWFFINDTSLEWLQTQSISRKYHAGNLFLLSFVDPAPSPITISDILRNFENFNVYKIGNFDGPYSWHFLSTIWCDRFKTYQQDEIKLHSCKYKFVSYSRKPHQHRIELYEKLIKNNLLNDGIATLGTAPKHFINDNPNNFSHTLGENVEDYREHGHWYNDPNEDYSIPHDIFSLGKLDIWQNHFLNVVNESMPNDLQNIPKQELMVTEKTLKPIIGLRPFLINGDPKTYDWLRQRGFKTFNHWFPISEIENPLTLHDKIIEVLLWLKEQSSKNIIKMYNEMLPNLLHNRNRFYEFANEEKLRINDIFKNGAQGED